MLEASLEFRKAEPNYKCSVKEIIAEKDKVVMKWEVIFSAGTIEVLGVYRIQNGKITELQEYYTGEGYHFLGGNEPQ